MRSAAPMIDISTDDLHHTDSQSNQFSLWSTGPSSPPFHNPELTASDQPPDSSTLSTPSTEFEFDSLVSLQIKDDSPVSPKLITSSAITPGFWGGTTTAVAPTAAAAVDVSLSDPLPLQNIPSPLASQPIPRPSAPLSPSVRQLLAEELYGEVDDDLDHLNFHTAPSTPLRSTLPIRRSSFSQRRLSQDEPFPSIGATERRRSSSALRDNQAYDRLAQVQYRNQVLQLRNPEPNSDSTALSTSSSAGEKNEDLDKSGVRKQGSKISMKWAFKDLLRKTVPSSNAEAHYITKVMGASSSKRYLPSTKSHPNLSTLASSPIHPTSSMSTPQASQPATPRRSSTHRSSSPARSSPHHPPSLGRPLNRTPMPSPPRSPLSTHAMRYQQNKAQSAELSRKTFLPYRQSLLGCLGGSGAFPPEQQAW